MVQECDPEIDAKPRDPEVARGGASSCGTHAVRPHRGYERDTDQQAAVALANKLARIVWATWHHDRRFDANYATRFDSEVPMRAAVA